jgi:hypothetical protein
MAEFVKNFDCKNEAHVMWLKDIGKAMAKVSTGDRVDIANIANSNPLPGTPKMKNPMDMAEIHFMLSMKYTTAVLDGEAFVPTNKTDVLFEGEVSRV